MKSLIKIRVVVLGLAVPQEAQAVESRGGLRGSEGYGG